MTSDCRADVYLAAAKRCLTRNHGLGTMDSLPHLYFSEVFFPGRFLERYRPLWETDTKERREIRVLLLCFMAAMVEAGDA